MIECQTRDVDPYTEWCITHNQDASLCHVQPVIDTLQVAKQELRANWQKGTSCPCCGQFVKLYRRKINSSQAVALLAAYKHNPCDWFHVSEFDMPAFRGGDFAKLRYWNLIEGKSNDDDSKKDSGMWRLTQIGRAFVKGECQVPEYIEIYNKVVVKEADKTINIGQALGSKFNYKELVR